MVLGTLTCVCHGAAAVFASESFEPAPTLEAVEAERCTALHGVPTMFIGELELADFSRYDLSSLRTGLMAGRALSDGDHETRTGPDAHVGDSHRLRSDRVLTR